LLNTNVGVPAKLTELPVINPLKEAFPEVNAKLLPS
jgi:hypothetical protein